MSRFDNDGDADGVSDDIPLFILRQARNISTSSTFLEYTVMAVCAFASHLTCPIVSSLKQFSRFASVSSLNWLLSCVLCTIKIPLSSQLATLLIISRSCLLFIRLWCWACHELLSLMSSSGVKLATLECSVCRIFCLPKSRV